ncbi:galactose mutarotase [Clostridia bacterium]|nr:galactose mutarotase [Clostridia bacterium]
MIHTIENDVLAVKINEFGAELYSITSKIDGTEFLWNGDERFWTGRAPILFPIVGKVKDGVYIHEDKSYKLDGHGFARRSAFELVKNDKTSAIFRLGYSEFTLKTYPFKFNFEVRFSLEDNILKTTYAVENLDASEMYFSVGGHPAFNCPIRKGEEFTDYYIEFSENETAGTRVINEIGMLADETTPFLNDENIVKLSHELFENGALVLSSFESDSVTLKSTKSSVSIRMNFANFPFLGIWTKPDTPFICLEPWYGLPDSPRFEGDLKDKKGILTLAPSKQFECAYEVVFSV